MIVRPLLLVVAVFVALWLALVVAVAALRPHGINLREAKHIVPDLVRLLRDLASDRTLPKGVRRRLVGLIAYLALPFDLIPDFIPVLGYADDVIVAAFVLRSVVRKAGADAVERHWHGTPDGLALLRRLCAITPPPMTGNVD